ncbi:MAG: type II toxin-antitoxin system HipA family toxin [Micavibrio sp.]
MTKTLDVYLHSHFVGHLIQNEHGDMVFSYGESWLSHLHALPLSHSLPLRKEPFSRNECRGFFAGILPEERKRDLVARNLGISARNDFAMIEQIGGECAGAVTFIPAGEKLPATDYQYRPLSDSALAAILKELPRRPLMAGEDGIRLSLAGAQDKIAVHVAGNKISVPLGGAPSTHILKPAIAHFEGVVFNEATCMKLAAAIGLPVAPVEIRHAGGTDFLLIERYDRKTMEAPAGLPTIQRMHQEDFCQALGIVSENKYQREGGPSLKNGFELLRDVSTTPVIDLQRFLDAIIFNFLVGNHDAHGKNFSLTADQGGLLNQASIRLAPLYDIVCTAFYPELSRKMAMKIGGEYESSKIYPHHFEKMAEECGLAKPLVKKRVTELATAVIAALDTITIPHPVADGVKALIREHSQRTIELFRD